MEIRNFDHWSSHLGRNMTFKVYGRGGKPILFIPCQSGRPGDFEDFGMVHHWAKWIEAGRCTVYSVDTIDDEAYAAFGADSRWRMENHERWYRYVVEELVPYIHHLSGSDRGIMTFGCSMGAMHGANLFFRRPDLFDGVLAISCIYDSKMFFGAHMDELLYQNTPVEYLKNLPDDHPYRAMYNERRMIFVVGQGAWEEAHVASTRWLEYVLREKGIRAEVHYWGYDVNHDWPWWYKMVAHYVPRFL